MPSSTVWTIVAILLIIALVLFIIGAVTDLI
jgi:hypothetical protein